mmetsp:Transcript_23263/g.37398  ORF Transcript_23263/g.37398 Transcript_23263/m.37398 type:complete len:276 (+) Transcript_23263:246-1073(+)
MGAAASDCCGSESASHKKFSRKLEMDRDQRFSKNPTLKTRSTAWQQGMGTMGNLHLSSGGGEGYGGHKSHTAVPWMLPTRESESSTPSDNHFILREEAGDLVPLGPGRNHLNKSYSLHSHELQRMGGLVGKALHQVQVPQEHNTHSYAAIRSQRLSKIRTSTTPQSGLRPQNSRLEDSRQKVDIDFRRATSVSSIDSLDGVVQQLSAYTAHASSIIEGKRGGSRQQTLRTAPSVSRVDVLYDTTGPFRVHSPSKDINSPKELMVENRPLQSFSLT